VAPARALEDALDGSPVSLEVRRLTVGPIAENCFILRKEGADKALVVDPGEEPERILAEIEQTGAAVEAILITHCHFDHVGAVAPLARATGAPVYVPEIETPILADIMSFTLPGFGPYESYEADEVVKGGEALELAGLTLDVLFTPGHSPGHVTYAVRDEAALFSGDVLFQGSMGRVDLPGGDGPTLMRSIQALLDAHSAETTVYPGHMGTTTLGAERATNPFLTALAR
jgi:glyoxylase-like metal-dependent hydrolase (beta-lactamase superfamily II)